MVTDFLNLPNLLIRLDEIHHFVVYFLMVLRNAVHDHTFRRTDFGLGSVMINEVLDLMVNLVPEGMTMVIVIHRVVYCKEGLTSDHLYG